MVLILTAGAATIVKIWTLFPPFLLYTATLILGLYVISFLWGLKKSRKAYVLNTLLGLLVVLTTSLSPRHYFILLHRVDVVAAALILVGGYLLQAALIFASLMAILRSKPLRPDESPSDIG